MRHLFKTTIQLSIYSIFLLAISININAQSCNFTVSTIGDTAVCSGETVQLQTFVNGTLPSNASYIWSPTTGLNNPNISNPVATVTNDQTYTVKVKALDNFNLVTNGDFENGSAGFTTNYAVGTGGTWGPLSIDGTYLITTNPNIGHSNFASCSDHTPAPRHEYDGCQWCFYCQYEYVVSNYKCNAIQRLCLFDVGHFSRSE